MMKAGFIILFIIYMLISCSERKQLNSDLIGKSLPSFNLLLTDSITYFDTNDIPKGRPIILFCFGPNCPYSHAQMGEIIGNIKELEMIRFYIITPYPFHEMIGFSEKYALKNYPNITVGMDYTYFFGNYFKASGVPYLAIYNKDRILLETSLGKLNIWQIKKLIER